jgi:hypothetical protein
MTANLKLQARSRILRAIFSSPALREGDFLFTEHMPDGPEAEAVRADAARLVYSRSEGGSAGPAQNTLNAAVAQALEDLRGEMYGEEDVLRVAGLFSIAAEVWHLARTQRPWRPPQAYTKARDAWLRACETAYRCGLDAGPLAPIAGRGYRLQSGDFLSACIDRSRGLELRLERREGQATWKAEVWRCSAFDEIPRQPRYDGEDPGPYFPRRLRLGFVSCNAGQIYAWLDEEGYVCFRATQRHRHSEPREFRSAYAVPEEYRKQNSARGPELEPPPPPPVEEEC